MPVARAAVLVDLENVVRSDGLWITPVEAERVLGLALQQAGGADFRLAVAPVSVLRRYVDVLARAGLPCEHVTPGPDAADLVLLEHARYLEERGYTHFTVVSGDHIFSDICRRHPTTVIVRRNQPVAGVAGDGYRRARRMTTGRSHDYRNDHPSNALERTPRTDPLRAQSSPPNAATG